MQEEWPLLIVVPASLRLTWAEELERWLPHLRPSAIHIIYNRSNRLPTQSEAQVQPLDVASGVFCGYSQARKDL